MFIAALVTVTKKYNQPRCLSLNKRINKYLRVSTAVMKDHDQSNLGEERVYWFTYPKSQSFKGSHCRNSNWAGNWRQEPGSRS